MHNEYMRASYVPVMHCEKMAVTDMSFRQRDAIEFLLKEGNLAANIYKRLRGVYGDVCMGTSSVRRWVKHFKDGNTDIVDQPRCGRPRIAATERNKQKVDELIKEDRRITVREIAVQLGVGHHAVQEMTEILGYRGTQHGWDLLSHPPYSPDFAPSDYYLFGSLEDHLRSNHYETDEAVQEAVRS
jgi:transposase